MIYRIDDEKNIIEYVCGLLRWIMRHIYVFSALSFG
ncbi:MAG: hypothetical protein L3K26_18560 [Candidatus Hydrogenedentes bacterium]|nr:hypothetical protein [Candidatus Hydrogenedentota bacterium]